jgi:hypothetical protein
MSTVDIEVPLRRKGRRQTNDASAPPPVRIPRIARLMALAIKFQDMVDRGEVRDYADLARLGYVSRARMTQIMNMLLLAPDLQEALLDSNANLVPEHRIRAVVQEVAWSAQRVTFEGLIRALLGAADRGRSREAS